jgi:hypothetical protein
MPQGYRAPDIPPEKVTPSLVRDELLLCFESANREFSQILNQPVSDEQLKEQVRQFVETTFENCGVSFVNPTKSGIIMAMEQCRAKAEKMMGPQGADVIKHHYEEMMKLVNRLPD